MKAKTNNKYDNAEVRRVIKKEIIYEYQPILGELLGYWRKVDARKISEEICVFLNHDMESYDRLFLNGQEINIDKIRQVAE